MATLHSVPPERRIAPARGLVLSQNARGDFVDLVDLKRWIRLNADLYKTDKVDVCMYEPRDGVLPILLDEARLLGVRLSLRTDCTATPEAFGTLEGLFDVFLTPRNLEMDPLIQWLEACEETGIPVRLQIQPPFPPGLEPTAFARCLADAGVVVANVALADPLLPPPPREDAATLLRKMHEFVDAFADVGLESSLLQIPFCMATEEDRARLVNRPQLAFDHQQYNGQVYRFAERVSRRDPNTIGKGILVPLGRSSSYTRFVDERLLQWILRSSRRHTFILIWSKLRRRLRRVWGLPAPVPENEEAYRREAARWVAQKDSALPAPCRPCRLRRICDRFCPAVERVLQGATPTPETGELVLSPLHFSGSQPKYYDALDAERLDADAWRLRLAEEANALMANHPVTREVDSADYKIEGQWTDHMPGGNRWYSFTDTEKISTVLARCTPPFTISATLGGGIAELAGFSFGRHCKILCPMESYAHRISLHVDADGRYVLLRDGIPVRPAQFEGVQYAPARLANVVEPRLCLCNIHDSIITQSVLLWEGNVNTLHETARIRYSFVIVSTRYSRRLQAVLQSLAHQRGTDLHAIEAVVCYVPGVDATDDVIESMKLVHPELRIVRAPFSESFVRSKGFMLNEALYAASGDWVILLDSDILLPPDMLAAFDRLPDSCVFAASDGRKMLTPETTAQLLLGELTPWNDWDLLMAGEGEFRPREAQGVPIGFFQAVRRACLEKVRYTELDHFEGADWFFGYQMREQFGTETRLDGLPVLHMDHGGSQWYGTQKQR